MTQHAKDFNYSSSLYIGETTHGRPQPVFYDLHTPIFNNKPPVCVITGAPGSGKTYLALHLAAFSGLLGKITAIVDPKGDFAALVGLSKEIGPVHLYDLQKGSAGMLDPCYMSDVKGERLIFVLEIISIFLGGLTQGQMSAISPIINDVIDEPQPSFQKMVEEFRASEDRLASEVGNTLYILKEMPCARLCFASSKGRRGSIPITNGVTVFTMSSLDFPKDGSMPSTIQERFSAGILFLITSLLKKIMEESVTANPKTIIIDEAHILIGSQEGARVIKNFALLGRSKNLAMILVTQNSSHLDNLDIENTISSRFAFRSTPNEAATIIEEMLLPANEDFEKIILGLGNGECLMRDCFGRYSTVKITSYKQDWREVFSTNPAELARRMKLQELKEKNELQQKENPTQK